MHRVMTRRNKVGAILTEPLKKPSADLDSIHRIFTIPEDPNSQLAQIERRISDNLDGFLQEHLVTLERPLHEIEQNFSEFEFPQEPTFVSEQAAFLLDKVVAHSVHTASPRFIGHMTSAIPYFMLPISKIMMALNQNVVKIETSRAFTPLERQVIGMLHHLVYAESDEFYQRWMHDADNPIGVLCSGGTVANLTALWAARNHVFAPHNTFKGVAVEGFHAACQYYDCAGAVVLVSDRGHYSLSKTADVLGIGRQNVIAVASDAHDKIDLRQLEQTIKKTVQNNQRIIALVGVAGSSETGSVDPLEDMADLAAAYGCHFHVDAAWGGPTLCSHRYRPLLKGIQRADSVTIDAHKQFYVPMGAGLVVFKQPQTLTSVCHHAEYIIRKGSKDLGSHTLEGSRAGMAMMVHSGFKVIGRKGYELLINLGIENAKKFAQLIVAAPDFELVSGPELNILTYRYCPADIADQLTEYLSNNRMNQCTLINEKLNQMGIMIQKRQRAQGRSFVSRTTLKPVRYHREAVVVFRVVLANPLVTNKIFVEVLEQQRELVREPEIERLIKEIRAVG